MALFESREGDRYGKDFVASVARKVTMRVRRGRAHRWEGADSVGSARHNIHARQDNFEVSYKQLHF